MKVYYQRWYIMDGSSTQEKPKREFAGFTLHTSRERYCQYISEVVTLNLNLYIDDGPIEIELLPDVATWLTRIKTDNLKYYVDISYNEVNDHFLEMVKNKLKTEIKDIELGFVRVWDY